MRFYEFRQFKKGLVRRGVVRFLPRTECIGKSVEVYVNGVIATVLFYGEKYTNGGKLRAVWNTLEAMNGICG